MSRGQVPFEAGDVAAKGAGGLVVLSVDVVGDRAAERHELGAGGDGEEEAARDGEVEDLCQRHAGLSGEDAGGGIKRSRTMPVVIEQGAVLQQANVAVAASQADGQCAALHPGESRSGPRENPTAN